MHGGFGHVGIGEILSFSILPAMVIKQTAGEEKH